MSASHTRVMARLTATSSVRPSHRADLDETIRFLLDHAPVAARPRLQRSLAESGNRTRHLVLPLEQLARLGGASERSTLYRRHATDLAQRAVAHLADMSALDAGHISAVVFISSTGVAAPSIETDLVRRFGLNERCRRVPLAQLGCAGGVAALALASEMVARDRDQRVLVVAVDVPSLHLQLAEPSYHDLIAAAQFADGAAAAVVSADGPGPEMLGTRSVLLPEVAEGGRVVQCDTGFRLQGSPGLPALIRRRAGDLVAAFTRDLGTDPTDLSFVVAHPRGRAVLDAVANGLGVQPDVLHASYATWSDSGNMVSASVYRALATFTMSGKARPDDLGMLLAFGTGVACEMVMLRWRSAPGLALRDGF